MKLWGKLWKQNHLIADQVVEEESEDTRTHKVFRLLEQLCLTFDLGQPIWLEHNIRDFQRRGKTRFSSDNFIEEIPFDYLEIQILEE